jgi:hypothetical protein
MRRYVFLCVFAALLALAVVSGCSKQQGKFGNFAKAQSVELVEDAACILKTAYPPAKTRLNLLHLYGDDLFGAALVETLRRDGYAVAEYVQLVRGDKYAESPAKPDGLDFAYVVDDRADEGGLRVMLFVGADTLSRLYAVGGKPEEPVYTPLGDWVRRY